MKKSILDVSQDNTFFVVRKLISNLKTMIDNTPFEQKMDSISKYLTFVRSFNSKGVQGIVGIVDVKSVNKSLIFKVSVDMNRSVEHEFEILENLNNLRKYCPHFVRSIGMINLPISTDFIFDSFKNSLFKKDEECLPRNIMFLELVNKLPFYKLCQDCPDKNVIISQILQVLLALEISQQKKKFTHYDLHTSNILVQMCEINSVFIYNLKGKKYCVPTFGFFPLIIDTGISYADCTLDKYMMSNTDNYDHGFQTTVFDHLNDVHHFLLSTFYYIEPDSDCFDYLSNKIKLIFRHLSVLRKSGWKMLPYDLCENVLLKIKEDCKIYRKFDLFYYYENTSVEVLNGLIKLPIKHRGVKDFSKCFPMFMEEYHKMIDINDFTEQDVLFVLRCIVDNINLYREEYFSSQERERIITRFKTSLRKSISETLKINVSFEEINYQNLLVSGVVLGENIETIYFELIYNNKKYIEEGYLKTLVKSPIDMFFYLSKNATPHFIIDNETIVYYFDVDNEKSMRVDCKKLTDESLKNIDRESFINKGELIIKNLF